ncbi:serine/threonine-protein kinase [Streptomyces sp. NPDC088194]|uniref:serine/threonine-protein kinase n=1 Tax=Streptomyces sp. NPDC088194 TaxID=3154931 RepID=UPI003450E281
MESLGAADPRSVGGYPLFARLGAGGMGQVYLARTVAGRPLALKTVRAEFGLDPAFGERFAREIRNADRVRSPWTAAVVDYSPVGASPQWLATEYVAAPSLADWVREHGPLPGDSVAALGVELCEALHAVHHAGLAHRDVKPSNVLLPRARPLLIDFGIARAAEDTRHTSTGAMIGSPGYMAPEQAASGTSAEPGDLFSLGAVLVYAATGRGPFNHPGETASTPALLYRVVHEEPDLSGVPAALLPALTALLAKSPADRPTALGAAELLRGPGGAAAAPSPWSGHLPPGLPDELAAREEEMRATLGDPPAPDAGPGPAGPAEPPAKPATAPPAAPPAPGAPLVAATTPYGPASTTFRHPAYQGPPAASGQPAQGPPGQPLAPPAHGSPGGPNRGGGRRTTVVAAAAVAVVLVVVGTLAVHRWRQHTGSGDGSNADAPTTSATATTNGTGAAGGSTGSGDSGSGSGSDSGSGSGDKLPSSWIGTWSGVGPGLASVTGKTKVTLTLTGGTRGSVVGKEVTHVTALLSGQDIGCTDTLSFSEQEGSTVIFQAVASAPSDPSSGTVCVQGRIYTLSIDSGGDTLRLADFSGGQSVGAPDTFTKQN